MTTMPEPKARLVCADCKAEAENARVCPKCGSHRMALAGIDFGLAELPEGAPLPENLMALPFAVIPEGQCRNPECVATRARADALSVKHDALVRLVNSVYGEVTQIRAAMGRAMKALRRAERETAAELKGAGR